VRALTIGQTAVVVTISRLLHTPVKSLRMLERASLDVGMSGVVDDRIFFLHGADGSSLRGDRRLRLCRATADYTDGVLTIHLPDGGTVSGVPELGEAFETRWDMDLTIPAWHIVGGDWSEALSDLAGESVVLARVAEGRGGWSGFSVSMIGTESIDALGLGPVDPRRFRMLVQTSGAAPFAEDAWVGRDVRVGAAVVHIDETCPRCVVTTVDPETGERDLDALRAMITAKGIADLGLYGHVVEPGRIRVGDPVEPC